jgi:hypothetical protein
MDRNRFRQASDSRSRDRFAGTWLEDEQPVVRPQQRPTPVVASEPKPAGGVSIQIQIPGFHQGQFKAFATAIGHFLAKKQVITIIIISLLILASWGTSTLHQHVLDNRAISAKQTAAHQAAGTLDLPTFLPTVPSDKQELVTPDGTHSRYDKAKGTYSFVDTINGQQFTVSQQVLPGGSSSAQTTVDAAAKSLKASSKLTTGWGTAYILTNQKYHSQTIVFSVKDHLLFIQSAFTLTNTQWLNYINTLQ